MSSLAACYAIHPPCGRGGAEARLSRLPIGGWSYNKNSTHGSGSSSARFWFASFSMAPINTSRSQLALFTRYNRRSHARGFSRPTRRTDRNTESSATLPGLIVAHTTRGYKPRVFVFLPSPCLNSLPNFCPNKPTNHREAGLDVGKQLKFRRRARSMLVGLATRCYILLDSLRADFERENRVVR